MVRDAPSFKLWALAIQAMLKETLNIDTTLPTVQVSVWFDEARKEKSGLDHWCHVTTLMTPRIILAWYGKDGPQNYSKWHNPAFQSADRADRSRA